MSNPWPDLYNIYAHIKFGENPLRFTKVIVLKLKYRCVAGRVLCQNWGNLPISYSKAHVHNINIHSKHWYLLKLSSRNKNRTCRGQVTVKNWRDLPINTLKPDLHNINTHTKFGENKLVLKLLSGNENMDVFRADNFVKNWQNLPISNPKADLYNINARIKFGGNPLIFPQVIVRKPNKRRDGRTTGGRTDVRTHEQPTWCHNIPSLSQIKLV